MYYQYFLIIIFLINSIKADEIEFEFKHTNFFQLINGNYILCTEKGIYLYDSQLKNSISSGYTFQTEVSSSDDFYFVTIEQFSIDDGGNIVILYKDKFYFYTKEGEYIFDTDLPFQQSGKFYTLVPYKKGDQLNVIIGYIQNTNTMVGYYKIDISNKVLSEITTTNIILRSNSNVVQLTSNEGFSCQLMISSQYGDLLVCFYIVTYYFGLNSYNIDDNFSESPIGYLCAKNIQTSYIKTAITPEKDRAIICCQNTTQVVVCNCYDINKNQLVYSIQFGEYIQSKFFSVTLSYSKMTKEFIVSGYNYDGKFIVSKFDSELNTKKDEDNKDICNPNFHISSCSVNYASMVYLSDTNSYSMMTSCDAVVIKSYTLPESCNPTEITPNSNNNNEQKNYSSEEVSITTNIQTTNTLVNTNIQKTFSSINNDKTYSSEIHYSLSSSSILSVSSSYSSSSISSSSKITSPQTTSFHETISSSIFSKESIYIPTTSDSQINSYKIKSSHISPILPSSIYEFKTTSYKIKSSYISPTTSASKSEINNDKETYNSIILEQDEKCPVQYLYENKNTKECTNSCEISQILNNECSINNVALNNIEEITNHMKNILNNTNITKDTNIVIQGNNVVYQIISSDNMNQNKKSNISVIDFGECEKKLKEHYDIDNLIIFKMDLKLNNTPPTIINYEVYNPNNLTKLDLSICDDMKIKIYSPYTPSQESLNKIIQLKEYGYDLYNPNDSFYQDICSPFTSDNETDILLSDRKIDYFENISLCEDSCTYMGYDYTIEKAECECNIKSSIDLSEDKVVSKETNFFSNFDLSSFSNIKILKCYKLVFSKKGQKNNKGSYIFIGVIIIFIILSLVFIINKLTNIAKILRKALGSNYSKISGPFPSSPSKKENKKKNKKKNNKKHKNKARNTVITLNSKVNTNYLDSQIKVAQKDESIDDNRKSVKSKNRGSLKIYSKFKNILPDTRTKSLFSSKITPITKKLNINPKRENTNKFNDEELNALSYKEALEYDKRTYFQYYWALIKKKQLILFTFVLNNDYNIFTIKLALFLFSFSLYFCVNTLFFEDKTMHNIYIDKGKFNILKQIPIILYSSIISAVISATIKLFALSEKEILKIRKMKSTSESMKKSSEIAKTLKLKFNLFFLISFLFLVLFWYCIAAFCAVYKNTQTILIKSTLSSFGISMIYPFGINLLPGFFRIPSLKATSKDKECLYKISQIIALI